MTDAARLDADALIAAVDNRLDQTIAELMALARIPSCAFPGFPRAELLRAAEFTVELFQQAGCPNARLIDMGEAPPAVYGELAGPPGSPTVLLYAHYDVQPAGDPSLWDSDPFEPVIRDGRIYGRGVADDKSGVALHLATVAALANNPPCTIRFIIEGDEEFGGSFEHFPPAHPELFQADAIVVADVGNLEVGVPTFVTSLRGVATAEVSINTLNAPVHSGLFGGPAPDALMTLIKLLSKLRDDAGDTEIPGVASSEWDGAEFTEDTFRELGGVLDHQPLTGTGSIGSRLFTKPVASVIGIEAPAFDGAINAVIPSAKAKVSLRLPPGVQPKEAQQHLMNFLKASAPWGVQVDVAPGFSGDGFSVDTDGPAFDAMRQAMQRAYGRDPVVMGSGGGIPLVSVLRKVAPEAAIILCGAQDTTCGIHSPNESLAVSELRDAALTQVLFLAFLSAGSPG